MNTLISRAIILALIAISVIHGAEQPAQQSASAERQARSVSGNGNGNGNSANSLHTNGMEYGTGKARLELERRQVAEFFTPKNVLKSIMKLLLGSQDESSATSRNVLGIITKVLDLLKSTLGQKQRSGQQGRTIRDSAEEVASAGVSMLQGYVKSLMSNDERCVQRYLCQASRDAVKEAKELGYVVATLGGYASSYLLEGSNKITAFKDLHQASQKGKNSIDDCYKLYPECSEAKE